jgi:hypothetical protein
LTTDGASRLDLEKQYDRVLQEYRFQVQLNWDRTKHYLTFNTVLFAAAVALSNQGGSRVSFAGISVLLLIAALNSFFGQLAVKLGHEYYRSIRATKTSLEKALGIDAHAINTTPGMKREHDAAPEGTPRAGSNRSARITTHVRWLLTVLGIASSVGSLYYAWLFCWTFVG